MQALVTLIGLFAFAALAGFVGLLFWLLYLKPKQRRHYQRHHNRHRTGR